MPILVLANKQDLPDTMSDIDIVKGMNLDYIVENKWAIMPISAKTGANLDKVVEWLLETSKEIET